MKLHIEKAIYGGDGLAHDSEGRAVFVPYVLPGELVEISAPRESGHGARMSLERIVEGSAQRVMQGCQHFGRCGGCQYQHASYPSQLAIKAEILRETLRRSGLTELPEVTVHAAEPWGYRNRIRLRVERVAGSIRFGYNLRQSREFLPIGECPIAAPLLWKAAEALWKLGETDPVGARWLRATSEVELFTTADESSLQVTLFLREKRSVDITEFYERLRTVVHQVVGVGCVVDGEQVAGSGREGLRYAAGDKAHWVTRGGFFQVNRFLVEELVRVVTADQKGLVAWDLFAGVGLFSRVLADGFGEVVAVEASRQAIRDLESAKVKGLRAVPESVVRFLRGAAVERERPDLVVVDPPRAGAGQEVCALLARMQVPKIVYVSCDPTTLARDLRAMVDSGYNLAELHLVDLFPQTYHLETVAVLTR